MKLIRRIRYICLFALLLHAAVSNAQTKPGKTKEEVQSFLIKAQSLVKGLQYDSAISIMNKALTLSRQNGYKAGEAMSVDQLAEIFLAQGKMPELRRLDSLQLVMAAQLKDTSLLINAYNRSGVFNVERGKHKEAEQYFITALHMGLDKQQSNKTAEVYSNLASLHLALGDKEKAIDGFFKALRLFEKNNNESGQGETFSNISSVYYLMGKVDDAVEYQKNSIRLREKQQDINGLVIANTNIGQLYILKEKYPNALYHLQQALTYAEKVKNAKHLATAYSGLSVYYNRVRNFDSAMIWQTKAIKLFEEIDNKPMLSRLYVAAGNLANVNNDSLAAVNYFSKALLISSELGNKENIGNAYEKMSSFYLSRKDFAKAYDNYKKFISYKDSVTAKSTLSKIEEIRTQYETEKKDNEIARLNTDQRIKTLQIEKQNALIAGNLLEAEKKQNEIELLSRSRELQELRINQQDEQLEKQLLLAKSNEQQLKLAEQEKQLQQRELKNSKNIRNFTLGGVLLLSLLGYFLFNRYQLKRKIKEQQSLLAVRNNIARDLHDEIGSTLTSIKILSEVSGKNISKDQTKAAAFLHKITEQSQEAQQGISDIVWAIKPDNDKMENMLVRMREYISHTLEPKNVITKFVVDEKALQQSLSMQQRRDFFLIFKEAINNIAKYAMANEVLLQLHVEKNTIFLNIQDDGKGFDPAQVRSSNGLKNMQSRAEALGGRLEIQSAAGKGTGIQLEIPAT